MMWSVILVADTRFWSSEDVNITPTPPTAAPCQVRVTEAVNIVDLPVHILIALLSGSSCRWTSLGS